MALYGNPFGSSHCFLPQAAVLHLIGGLPHRSAATSHELMDCVIEVDG